MKREEDKKCPKKLESQDDEAYVIGKGKPCDRDIKTPGPGREAKSSRAKSAKKDEEVKKHERRRKKE